MNLNFLILGEYSYFVWPAFIFSFLIFFVLYVKTYQELKKLEKVYLNTFEQTLSLKKTSAAIEDVRPKNLIF